MKIIWGFNMVFNENVLARTRFKEIKEGVSYPKKDGKLYKACKWIYIIAFAYTMVINFLYACGMLLMWDTLKTDSKYYFISVLALTAVLIGALILSRFNNNFIVSLVFGGVNLLSSVALIFIFANLMPDDMVRFGLKISFYYRHLAPLIIIAVCAVIMASVVVSAYFKTKKAYNRVLEILYDEYNALEDTDKPEWEAFISNYQF